MKNKGKAKKAFFKGVKKAIEKARKDGFKAKNKGKVWKEEGKAKTFKSGPGMLPAIRGKFICHIFSSNAPKVYRIMFFFPFTKYKQSFLISLACN